MSIIEIIAVVYSLLSVWLTIKNNIYCWPIGIVGIVFYAIIFYQNNNLGNLSLQFIYFIQSFIGWYKWNEPKKYKISWLDGFSGYSYLISTVISCNILYLVLYKLGSNDPFFDSATAILSIVATILLIYHKIENWIYWIVADILFIRFFYISGLYLSSVLYLIFLILAVIGLIKWTKDSKIA